MTQDVCAVGVSAGIETFGVGVSGGKHVIDKNCERLKLARILNDFGMKVAAVAILCQDERVFESMIQAGTPCPIDGKIGKEAKALWSKYDHERPDYDIYVKRMKNREKKEKAIAKKKALEEKRKAKEQAFKDMEKDMKEGPDDVRFARRALSKVVKSEQAMRKAMMALEQSFLRDPRPENQKLAKQIKKAYKSQVTKFMRDSVQMLKRMK